MRNERYMGRIKKGILTECVLVLALTALVLGKRGELVTQDSASAKVLTIENDYIKWVDFTVSYEALCKAYDWDVETHGTEYEIDWVELLAYTAAKTGGKFDRDALKTMEKAAEKLAGGESTLEELTEDLKYYPYYKEAYDAAIGGLVGEYWEKADAGESSRTQEDAASPQGQDGEDDAALSQSQEEEGGAALPQGQEEEGGAALLQGQEEEGGAALLQEQETRNGNSSQREGEAGGDVSLQEQGSRVDTEKEGYVKRYGLKGYFPLARGFDYTHYDDFGAGRSYGYARKHLGHDMMGLVGTPIMAIESGVVTALGWNQYGGWRIGISSFDGKRYYYYAHLRQNYPYAEGLEEGSVVTAGDVIGYMGHTGYSAKENVNNIKIVHLHWGLQLIFDESQKEGNNEIWIDVYPLTRFLAKHTQAAVKVEGTKEWVRTADIVDPAVEEYEAQQ